VILLEHCGYWTVSVTLVMCASPPEAAATVSLVIVATAAWTDLHIPGAASPASSRRSGRSRARAHVLRAALKRNSPFAHRTLV
jgi:hypothetical protein